MIDLTLKDISEIRLCVKTEISRIKTRRDCCRNKRMTDLHTDRIKYLSSIIEKLGFDNAK